MNATPFDALYAARERCDLSARLYAEAMGDDYPAEIAASSSCDWPLVALVLARLRLRPGQLLVDAACGTGGLGLWLARELRLRLCGFDLSTVAVARAAQRRAAFGLAGRASFHVADLAAPGLPGAVADAAVCVDALGFCADRAGALRELGRLLAPGGRLALTRAVRRGAEARWERDAAHAGLLLEHVDERPGEPAMWARLYRLRLDRADELRAAYGEAADVMLDEAKRRQALMPGRRAVLLTLRRPPAADTMCGPDPRRVSGPEHRERTRL